jgi:hypothetical protein
MCSNNALLKAAVFPWYINAEFWENNFPPPPEMEWKSIPT